jgi:hypothetical protein
MSTKTTGFKKLSKFASRELRHELERIQMLVSLLEFTDQVESVFNYYLGEIKNALDKMDQTMSTINTQVRLLATKRDAIVNLNSISLSDYDEVCFIDCDERANLLGEELISIVLPSIKLTTFQTIDIAIAYFVEVPKNRILFLDFNSISKSGWKLEELCEYLQYPIVLLATSSLQDKHWFENTSCATGCLTKPLTLAQIAMIK